MIPADDCPDFSSSCVSDRVKILKTFLNSTLPLLLILSRLLMRIVQADDISTKVPTNFQQSSNRLTPRSRHSFLDTPLWTL